MVTTKIVAQSDRAARPARRRRPGRAKCRWSSASSSRADGRALVDCERRRRTTTRSSPLARDAHRAAPRPPRGHQGRRRGHARARHPRARPAQAGARRQDRFRRDARRSRPRSTDGPRHDHAGRVRAEHRRRTARASVPHRAASLVADGGGVLLYDDPMSKVLGLDAQSSGPLRWVGYTLGGHRAHARAHGVAARVMTLVLESMNRRPRRGPCRRRRSR